MIPKVLHQIWLGDEEPNDFLLACRESLLRLHPEWVHTLWRFKNADDADKLFEMPALEKLDCDFKGLYRRMESYPGRHNPKAIQSDLLRVCILYAYGGVYLDLDMYGLRPLDDLLADPIWVAAIRPSLVGEAAMACEVENEKMGLICHNYGVSAQPHTGVCSLGLTWIAIDYGVKVYDSEYFIPHGRDNSEQYRYNHTDKTKTIHCWSTNTYDLEVMETIGRRARRKGAVYA